MFIERPERVHEVIMVALTVGGAQKVEKLRQSFELMRCTD